MFWFLILSSIIVGVYALYVRSWIWLILSGFLIFPPIWFISGYPFYYEKRLLIYIFYAVFFLTSTWALHREKTRLACLL